MLSLKRVCLRVEEEFRCAVIGITLLVAFNGEWRSVDFNSDASPTRAIRWENILRARMSYCIESKVESWKNKVINILKMLPP